MVTALPLFFTKERVSMNKNLFLIGGTMGVGKTTVSQILKKKLPRSVFLDGDWCWDASPFVVNDSTREMVMDNVTHLLSNFIRCPEYENVIFCWVLHEEGIINEILARIPTDVCGSVHLLSLTSTASALKERLQKDITAGIRLPDITERSIARLPLYESLPTVKIDTTDRSPEEVADLILKKQVNQNEK